MRKNALLGALVFSSALVTGAWAEDKPQMAFVVNAASDFWKLAEAGVNAAQEELPNYETQFRYPAQGTAAQQNALMDDLVAAGIASLGVRIHGSEGSDSRGAVVITPQRVQFDDTVSDGWLRLRARQ